jgi:signal transduction histidine kinase
VHGPVNESQREALKRVARSQQRLLTLINDVLNFVRLDAGRLDYNLIDIPIGAALAQLEPFIEPQVRAKGLIYRLAPCGGGLTVYADPDRLQQVFLNLLSNAIKFTPKGGTISVDCEENSDAIAVHVRDTGTGIAADRVRAIFEPFVQVNRSHTRPHDGVGLGLSISRDLIRGMGGDLTVESELGKGSVFTVRMPRARAASGTTQLTWAAITPQRTPAVHSASQPGNDG